MSIIQRNTNGSNIIPRLYINENNKTDYSDRPKIGYRKGCGCRLSAKTRLAHARCLVKKW